MRRIWPWKPFLKNGQRKISLLSTRREYNMIPIIGIWSPVALTPAYTEVTRDHIIYGILVVSWYPRHFPLVILFSQHPGAAVTPSVYSSHQYLRTPFDVLKAILIDSFPRRRQRIHSAPLRLSFHIPLGQWCEVRRNFGEMRLERVSVWPPVRPNGDARQFLEN